VVVTVGTDVRLGGRSWTTQQTAGGALILKSATADDNGRQRVARHMQGVAHEVQLRKTELEALAAQKAKLTSDIEEVSSFCVCSFGRGLSCSPDNALNVERGPGG
jgi:hypothetical protein